MSRFATQFQGGPWAQLADLHGREITYTARGGSSSNITAIWEVSTVGTMDYPGGQQSIQTARLQASGADIPNPDPEDTVTVDGVVWAVTDEGVEQTSPVVVLRLERRDQRRLGGRRMER